MKRSSISRTPGFFFAMNRCSAAFTPPAALVFALEEIPPRHLTLRISAGCFSEPA